MGIFISPIFVVAKDKCLYNNKSMNHLTELSIERISSFLEGFHKANNKYNFRCPFCGDSAKSKLKMRGWLYEYEGNTYFKCFNCDKSTSYRNFLKELFEDEYYRYAADKLFSHENTNPAYKPKNTSNYTLDTYSFSRLRNLYPATEHNKSGQYLLGRKITNLGLFYHTENYGALLEEMGLKEYEKEFKIHEPRLLIPHFDRNKNLTHIQMRSFSNMGVRYKTYKVIDSYKLWNLNNINLNKKIYITEGALDGSFVENCCAMSGSDAQLEKSILGNFKENLRIILDNEPRNPVILEKYKKLIARGYIVFHWPDIPYKDINECILNNFDILQYIYDDVNYFKGLKGNVDFVCWKKY